VECIGASHVDEAPYTMVGYDMIYDDWYSTDVISPILLKLLTVYPS
jgi:hypothetical protein